MQKTGVFEWAAESRNIQIGCEHGCRYCYAQHRAVHRFGYCNAEQWLNPVINQNKVDQSYKKKVEGGIMFPSTHDITEKNLGEYLRVLGKLLDAGNQVLIVSKPNWYCIETICKIYRKHKDQIKFRFTIGSTIDEVLRFWEPNAPNFVARRSCLEYAFHAGFKTSVSCEPYLDANPTHVYEAVKDYLTDSFWLGKLRNFNSRVDLTGATDDDMRRYVNPLKRLQGDDFVLGVVKVLKDKPFMKFKDSIREVISKGKQV